MISDRGPQFAAQVFQELCDKLEIKSRLSTAYHPQTDGQTERMNREIEAYLRIYCGAHPETWTEHLTDMEFSHNQRVNANSGITPFESIMGYNPIAIPMNPITAKHPSVEHRLKELKDIRKEALAAHEMARIRMAERVTRHFVPFNKGDKVWLEAKNIRVGGDYRKLRALREGPFEIMEVLGPLTYRLKLPRTWRIHDVFHASLLSAYRTTAIHGPAWAKPPPEIIEDEEEWEPEAILKHKKVRGGALRFLVKWKEYDVSENSWEPEENLEHSKDLLNAYKRRVGLSVEDIEAAATWINNPPSTSLSSSPSPELSEIRHYTLDGTSGTTAIIHDKNGQSDNGQMMWKQDTLTKTDNGPHGQGQTLNNTELDPEVFTRLRCLLDSAMKTDGIKLSRTHGLQLIPTLPHSTPSQPLIKPSQFHLL